MSVFGGRFKDAAKEGYAFALAEGFRGFGPAIYAELMSYGKNPWVYQSSMAESIGCSVRTVQRWLRAFREKGLLQCWRGKKGEVPPGASGPIRCGFSNRAMTAWHAAGTAFRAMVENVKARREQRLKARAARARGQKMSAEQIEAKMIERYGPGPPK